MPALTPTHHCTSYRWFKPHSVVRRSSLWLASACLLLLAGCASPRLAATVTRFHQWPARAEGVSYTIAPMPVQDPSADWLVPQPLPAEKPAVHVNLPALEYQTYAAYLDRALQAQGLVPAAQPAQARMVVNMAVQAQTGVVQERVLTMRPMVWLGYGGAHWRSGMLLHTSWHHGYDSDIFGWNERMVSRPVQSYRLRIWVDDRGLAGKALTGAPTVFDARAEYMGRPVALAAVMPYLIRAVFEDFPGANGQTRQLVFDTQTGELLPGKSR